MAEYPLGPVPKTRPFSRRTKYAAKPRSKPALNEIQNPSNFLTSIARNRFPQADFPVFFLNEIVLIPKRGKGRLNRTFPERTKRGAMPPISYRSHLCTMFNSF